MLILFCNEILVREYSWDYCFIIYPAWCGVLAWCARSKNTRTHARIARMMALKMPGSPRTRPRILQLCAILASCPALAMPVFAGREREKTPEFRMRDSRETCLHSLAKDNELVKSDTQVTHMLRKQLVLAHSGTMELVTSRNETK